jgi:hypothetical protein
MSAAVVVDGVAVSPHMRHVWRLSTPVGMYEHCLLTRPLPEHGFCTDDSARLLVLAARERADATAVVLADRSLRFLELAHRGRGRFANRRAVDGSWLDDGLAPDCDDASGRALWGLGSAVAHAHDSAVRDRALELFDEAVAFRSPSLRSTAFAVLGAGEIVSVDPSHGAARALIRDATAAWGHIGRSDRSSWRRRWPWPERRLHYANAVIPEMLIVAGRTLGDSEVQGAGLSLLHWLADVESSHHGWLSVTPARGWGAGEPRPAFDQQPIEVAALADAAATAATVDRDSRWGELLDMCGQWFLGRNDIGTPMLDWATGGGFDGLTPHGPNLNEGAESTIAAVTTMQHTRRLMLSRGAGVAAWAGH